MTDEITQHDTRVATRRTTHNAAVIGGIVWLVERFTDLDIDTDSPLLLLAVPVVIGVGYRASRWIAAKYPSLAWVLFGNGTTPEYIDAE